MANGGRRVVIDDTHPSIVYSTNPSWLLDRTGVLDNAGNFGTSLNTTLHGTNGNGSFSFNFCGTAIDIYGTNTIRNSSGVIDPLWNCYLNGVQIKSSPPFQYQENNWWMCGIGGLLDMNHTFTLSVSTSGQPFWFDYLVYTPSPNTTLQNDSVVFVPFSDSALVYDSSWQYWSNLSAITSTSDASVLFRFTGTSLSWYGIYPKELPARPALASFSIDGGQKTSFRLQGLPANASTAYNQLLFRTDVYAYGQHTLIVNFAGDNTTTPLSLAYILLQTGDTDSGTTTPTEVESAPRRSINIAGLVCGVVALFVVIAISLVYFFIIKKRRQAKIVTNASPINTPTAFRPAPTVPTARHSTVTTPNFDLASSSPYIEGTPGEVHSRRSTWHERLRTSFFAAFNRTPHLGMVLENASTADHSQQQRSPQILTLWARRNRWRHSHHRLPDVNVPHRPRMPPHNHREHEHQAVPMDEYVTSGQPESGAAVVGHSDGNLPTASLSLPSVSAGLGRSTSSADASYYGGYRTKRDMIELENRQQGR